jgi:hypothetical protein
MPQTYKILGQITPSANVITNIYVTGASTSAVIGSLIITNTTTNLNLPYQLHVRPINETLNVKHLLTYHIGVPPANTVIVNGGITMGPNTILAVNVVTTGINFQAYGVEIT